MKLRCTQCQDDLFYLVYNKIDKEVWGICDECDTRLARVSIDAALGEISPQQSSGGKEDPASLKPALGEAILAILRDTTRLLIHMVRVETRLDILEIDK